VTVGWPHAALWPRFRAVPNPITSTRGDSRRRRVRLRPDTAFGPEQWRPRCAVVWDFTRGYMFCS